MATSYSRIPKLVTVLQEGYSRGQFVKDLTAGVIVGIVALPLAIAFAIASGVKPEQGLYTAIIAGFLISSLSGSRVQIGGPTGAFIVIVYGIVQQYGYEGLATATLLAGILLIVMGVAGLGTVIKYIPYPVTVGFTAGIALIIATGQLRDFLGLSMESVPSDFIEKIEAYATSAGSVNIHAVWIGLLTIGLVQFWPRITRRIPGSLVAIIVTTLLVQLLGIPVYTIASRFGEVPGKLPAFQMPDFRWSFVTEMFSPALSIALLGGIESLLSAVVADGMTGRRHRSNMELIAQGVANIASPLFGGIPATGAIARTATNIKSGGRTPVAGMVHAIVLLLIMLLFGKWAALIPMATLAGILLIVAYNMSEWRLFIKLLKSPRSDIAILIITFVLTVLIDLTVAIQVGVVLAALLFMRRMVDVTNMGYITTETLTEEEEDFDLKNYKIPPHVEIFEITGPFFFGATDKFVEAISLIENRPSVLILRMRNVPSLDATGMTALEKVYERTTKEGTHLIICGIQKQPLAVMKNAGFLNKVGNENIFENFQTALLRAKELPETTSHTTPI